MFSKKSKSQTTKSKQAITDADTDQLYRRPPSLTDWLPWVDYETESQTFTLEDGYSAAAMFEITGVSTEARSDQFLKEIQTNIQTCINHTIPALDNPFVLQCFVVDEDSLSDLSKAVENYATKHCRQTPEHRLLSKNVVTRLQRHFKRMTATNGLFEDTAVSGSQWKGKVRRVRVFLYRRREPNDGERIDPVTEINQVAERFVTQMQATGIGIRRCDDNDLYAWLLRWFNPGSEVTGGDLDALTELLTLPKPEERSFSHDLSDLLFLSQPEVRYRTGRLVVRRSATSCNQCRCLAAQTLSRPLYR